MGWRTWPGTGAGALGSAGSWRRVAPAALIVAALASGCVRAAGSVAEPTALERQLLGAYQQLDRELVWVSSVRGPASAPTAAAAEGDVAALRMRLLQRFNEDDREQLADWRCVAEGRDAELLAAPCSRLAADPTWQEIRARVLREENEARAVIIDWAAANVARGRGLREADPKLRARVRAAYAEVMREAADPDHLVEAASGELVPASTWRP